MIENSIGLQREQRNGLENRNPPMYDRLLLRMLLPRSPESLHLPFPYLRFVRSLAEVSIPTLLYVTNPFRRANIHGLHLLWNFALDTGRDPERRKFHFTAELDKLEPSDVVRKKGTNIADLSSAPASEASFYRPGYAARPQSWRLLR